MTITSSETPRRHDLDALRSFAMLLGIALHGALTFVPIPWAVQDRYQHGGYGLFFLAVHGFRMPLFFLLSGFFTAMLCRRRGLATLVEQRVRRILIPLVLACMTIIPLMWIVVIWAATGRPKTVEGTEVSKRDIWTAAARGNLEDLKKHIDSGFDLQRQDPLFAQTPLAWAACGNHAPAVELLLEAGADPNARYGQDNTALHAAAFFGHVQCAEHLLAAGADVGARNVRGETPLNSLRHDRGTTEFIAGIIHVQIDFEQVQAGRKRIAPMLIAAGSSTGEPGTEAQGNDGKDILEEIIKGLMGFPFFHHLWFLWFLCFLVTGFVATVALTRSLPLPGPPRWLCRSPACWLWVVPLTMVPQAMMHMGGKMPGFGPDTSAGLLPMPHVLLYYAIFFGFGALYYESRDASGRPGRAWWACLILGLGLFPVSLGFSLGEQWTRDLADEQTHRLIGTLLEVLYTWFMIFGFMGLFRRFFSSNRPRIRYLSDASYWLYLTHLPFIILAQSLVRNWPVPSFLKFCLVTLGVTVPLLVVYDLAVRYTLLGRLLNGPRSRPPPP